MNDKSGTLDNKIRLQRKLIKIRLGIVIALLSPLMIIALPLSWFFERFMDWKDGQYQKIEDLRVDLVYLKEHGMTHDEYYGPEEPTESINYSTED